MDSLRNTHTLQFLPTKVDRNVNQCTTGKKDTGRTRRAKQNEDGSRDAARIVSFTHASITGLTEWTGGRVNLILAPVTLF